jgi:hypothetical protein
VVVVEDAGRWVVVVVRVGVEVQTGDIGSRSLGGAGLCCWCRFGIACRNGVDGRSPGNGEEGSPKASFVWENKSSKLNSPEKKRGVGRKKLFLG